LSARKLWFKSALDVGKISVAGEKCQIHRAGAFQVPPGAPGAGASCGGAAA
jgi:hypothetical protein